MAEEMPGLPGMRMMLIRIKTEDGRLAARVGVADMPMHLSETVPWMQALQERLVHLAVVREEKAGHSISCRKGCGACCRQLVPLAIPEAYHLQQVVETMPAGRREEIEKRFEANLARLADCAALVARMERGDSDREELNRTAQEYFRLEMACPFLEDESCSIHEDRPLACREFNVISPAEWCADPFSHAVQKIRVAKRLTTVMARLTHQKLQVPARLIPLVFALRFARENAQLDDQSWNGPELWQELMNLVAEERASGSQGGAIATD